jgi:hypothetical protein
MQQTAGVEGSRRMATVQQDWISWLPEDKDRLFDATLDELEVSYVILSVALNDAFTLCQQGKLGQAREGAAIFGGLFDRVAVRLRGVLRTLNEHGRRFGTEPNVVPLCADFFRSERAQQLARANNLGFLLVLRVRARFFRKLVAIEQTLAVLRSEAQQIAGGITDGTIMFLPTQWTRLEVLHYDLNTCLRETTIVLKSFLCALPSDELTPFRKRLSSRLPAAWSPCARRATPFLSTLISAARPCQATLRKRTTVAAAQANLCRRRLHPRKAGKDNSPSRQRIPSPRMRPDGTGGPHETN